MMMILTMMIIMCFLHPEGSQAQSAPGGRPMNYNDDADNNDDDDDDDDDDDGGDDEL